MVSARQLMPFIFLSLLTGCVPNGREHSESCPSVDLSRYDALEINPISGIEFGEIISSGGRPVDKKCMSKRVCEINDTIRERYSQSYFINLETYGGQLLSDTFPDVIEKITETEPGVKHFYLNNFCVNIEQTPKG